MNLTATFGSLVGVGASTLVAIRSGTEGARRCYSCFGERGDAEQDYRLGIYDRGIAFSLIDIALFSRAEVRTRYLMQGEYAGDSGGDSRHAYLHGVNEV